MYHRFTIAASVVTTLLVVLSWTRFAGAQLQATNVLVIYNSKSDDANGNGVSDSQDVFNYYRSKRDGVLGLDLNNVDLPAGDIDYSQFIRDIRDPVRDHLTGNNLLQQISVITLTRGIPHRIFDTDNPMVGDSASLAGLEFDQQDITYASVDSELTLLWQPLDEGEQGGKSDSYSDGHVFNPYHNRNQSIAEFDRSNVADPLFFENLSGFAWNVRVGNRLGDIAEPGRLTLTARLDGDNVRDVQRMIDRGYYASYNPQTDALLFDEVGDGELDNAQFFEDDDQGYLGDDYDETVAMIQPSYQRVIFDEGEEFIVGTGDAYEGTAPPRVVEGNIAALVSYGGNHNRGAGSLTNDGFVESFRGQYVDGAMMNTLESYSARQFGGIGDFLDQGQLSQFVANGGAFGIGQVWEPFAFSVADNEVLLKNFLMEDLTWVESAWSSISALSWQNVVLGDPLATARVIADAQDAIWFGASPQQGQPGDGVSWSDAANWYRGSTVDTLPVVGDRLIFAATANPSIIVLNQDMIADSVAVQADYTLQQNTLVIRSGSFEVDENATARLSTNLFAGNGVRKRGGGRLIVNGQSSNVVIEEGTLGGSGEILGVEVMSGAIMSPGDGVGVLVVDGDYVQHAGSTLQIDVPSFDTYDQVRVSSNASLAGRLSVLQPLPSIPAESGDVQSIDIVTAGKLEGRFDELLVGGSTTDLVMTSGTSSRHYVEENIFHVISYSDTTASLSSYRAPDGDTDGDFDIDSADRTTMVQNWTGALDTDGGKRWIDGDFDEDGDVDSADNTSLLIHWTGALEQSLAQLVYDPITGAVVIESTTDEPIVSFAVSLSGDSVFLQQAELTRSNQQLVDNTEHQIGFTDALLRGETTLDLGPILPAGMNQTQLETVIETATYAGRASGGQLQLTVVPEPDGRLLMLISLLGLLKRRTRRPVPAEGHRRS